MMIAAQVELTQALKQQRQFVARTGSGHNLILDDAAGGTGAKPIEMVAVGLAGCTAFDVITVLRQKYHQKVTGYMLPQDLNITVTRNYGETAKDKSDELLKHLFIATLSVTLLIALALGWRESGVVLLAVPVTLALTLAIFYLFGYTLNRVGTPW